MKKTILLSLIAFGSLSAFAQSKKVDKTTAVTTSPSSTAVVPTVKSELEQTKGTTISFDKTTYDFGSIPQGIPAEATFTFTNTGKEPLVLKNVRPACGCTTPFFTQDPVLPGKKGVIKASYNAASPGGFSKPITVEYNGGQIQLNLAGNVEKTPETSVPENKSSILKK